MSTPPAFTLWLEWEEVGGPPDHPAIRPQQNFGNVAITLADGRRYALNVWTFDFVPLARWPWPYEPQAGGRPALYVIPPDLMVERLDRPTMEAVVSEMLKEGDLREEWLSPGTSR